VICVAGCRGQLASGMGGPFVEDSSGLARFYSGSASL
jgi:hypothetical protein